MANVFISTVRPIGTSLGLIIPNEVVKQEGIKSGRKVEVAIMSTNFDLIRKLMGTMKGAPPFERDRKDRI
jgi:antitoxin component of MazEF toxin-antitoxin module